MSVFLNPSCDLFISRTSCDEMLQFLGSDGSSS